MISNIALALDDRHKVIGEDGNIVAVTLAETDALLEETRTYN